MNKRNRVYGTTEDSKLERVMRRSLQGVVCFFFGHRTIGIITTNGELKTRREECLMCARTVSSEEPYTEDEGG